MALFKRKDKDGKHKGENAIGKIIYGFLLFMPLIAVGVACLYAILNKNAYESYSDSYLQSTTKVTNTTLLVENQNYLITYKDVGGAQMYNDVIYYYSNIDIDWTDYGATSSNTYVAFMINSYQNPNNRIRVYYYDSNTELQSITLSIWGSQLKTIYFTLNNYTILQDNFSNTNQDYILYLLTIKQNTLDNMFYYQLNKLEESDLFNWSKNTGAYTVMHNVTEGIGITNTYTPMLMTYWLLISVIYFIFDIALILVWAVHDKIHELKDAI